MLLKHPSAATLIQLASHTEVLLRLCVCVCVCVCVCLSVCVRSYTYASLCCLCLSHSFCLLFCLCGHPFLNFFITLSICTAHPSLAPLLPSSSLPHSWRRTLHQCDLPSPPCPWLKPRLRGCWVNRCIMGPSR